LEPAAELGSEALDLGDQVGDALLVIGQRQQALDALEGVLGLQELDEDPGLPLSLVHRRRRLGGGSSRSGAESIAVVRREAIVTSSGGSGTG
jgi:hypothetical protein